MSLGSALVYLDRALHAVENYILHSWKVRVYAAASYYHTQIHSMLHSVGKEFRLWPFGALQFLQITDESADLNSADYHLYRLLKVHLSSRHLEINGTCKCRRHFAYHGFLSCTYGHQTRLSLSSHNDSYDSRCT